MGIYNKQAQDFEAKSEWDDYLEAVEDIIFNLVNRISVDETEQRVKEYERENRFNITANQARQANEQKKAQLEALEAEAAVPDGKVAIPIPFQPPTLLAAQPLPLVAPTLDAEGRLPPPRPSASRFNGMAAASGWSPDLPKMRAMKEAFTTLLVLSK